MTTIVAIRCTDGVVLASDRRASKGGMIGSKVVKKIYEIDSKKAVAIAGQLSDANYLVNLVKAEAKLIEFNRGFPLTVKEVSKLLSNMLYSGMRSYAPYITELLVAGIDETGPKVFEADISGAVTEEMFTSSGSGSPMAYGVLEASYRQDLTVEEGAEIAKRAVKSAMERDPGSGNGIQVYKITERGSEIEENGGVAQ
ncbi:MAG: proteasome subunit beta [Candidatus Verstraetearchaeota archaeon]|nr:proteasome subunit beta [Candidatus Verstraetearchaeota archaeon]